MNDEEILTVLRRAHEYSRPEDLEARKLIVMGASFAELGVSSVSSMEMAGFVEDELDVQFPDDELARLGTVNDFVALIRRHSSPERR